MFPIGIHLDLPSSWEWPLEARARSLLDLAHHSHPSHQGGAADDTTLILPSSHSSPQIRAEMTAEWQSREAALRAESADQRKLVEQLTTAGSKTAEYIRNMQVWTVDDGQLL